jgi:4-diphosphocytidyl-2-C-methyl-D-erythritol kinase
MITRPPVKVNLGLNVLRRRPDGYHDIDTVFLPFHGLHDTLEIVAGDDWSRTSAELFDRYSADETSQAITPDGKLMITIFRRGGVAWDPLKDLTVKAFAALSADYSLPPVKIFLEKTSPVGAGLGGGSADASYTLRSLSSMFLPELTAEDLLPYAAKVGSDCPFFLYDGPMAASGRGEILSKADIPALEGLRLEVTVPEGVQVSTAEAYAGIVPAVPELSLKEVLNRPAEEWKELLVNDFEKTVFAKNPAIKDLKESMYRRGAVYSSMSGSGSAVFALFRKD